jgi:hypothetical protein
MIEKPNLTENELNANYEEFMSFVKDSFTGDRRKKLLEMYSEDQLGLVACTAPASMSEHFHLAVPGGYLMHVMHVVRTAQIQQKLFETMGAVIDFTDEERNFAALHHDLGKLGTPGEGEYYIPEDQNWKIRRGDVYGLNPDLQYMDATDRAIYTLQKYEVSMTWKEFLSIKLSDGMYKESNKAYLSTFNKDMHLKSELPRIIHISDYMSCMLERNLKTQWESSPIDSLVAEDQ